MSFNADKCIVLAKDPVILQMGGNQLPQEDLVKYLGIYFDYKGPVWRVNCDKLIVKAKKALMSLIKFGFKFISAFNLFK
jgi:hypothetical protein